jgi:hypothetical protein
MKLIRLRKPQADDSPLVAPVLESAPWSSDGSVPPPNGRSAALVVADQPPAGTESLAEPLAETAPEPDGPPEPKQVSPAWADVAPSGIEIGQVRPAPIPLLAASNVNRLPNCAADGGRIGSWWLSAASLAGMSHVGTARTRQDEYAFGLLPDGSLVAVVTDGLGSYAETAQIGAGLMARLLVRHAATDEALDADVLRRCLGPAQAAAIAHGKKLYGLRPEQLSCTLVACRIVAGGVSELIRVGDAAAFAESEGEGEAFEPVFDAAGETFVNIVGAACPRATDEQVESATRTVMGRLLLATDGLAGDIAMSKQLRDALDEAWCQPTSAALMLETLRYRRQGSHDDRTALVIWPLTGAEASDDQSEEAS